ncbi:hypothetical protein JCM10212_004870 [Sporobolomyces blumeae]
MPRGQWRRLVPASSEDESDARTDYSDDQGAASGRRKSTSKGKKKGARKSTQRARDDEDDQDDDGEMDEDGNGDDDDDDGARGKGKGELGDGEKKELIQAIVRYVLFNETHRRVLKRDDIVKNVLTDGRGRHFNSLMPKAQKLLKDVVGMELILLRPKDVGTSKNPPKAWVLSSTLPQPLLRYAATSSSPSYSTPTRFSAGNSDDELLATGAPRQGGKGTLRAELREWAKDEQSIKATNRRSNNGNRNDDDDEEEEEEEEGAELGGGVMRDAKREEGPAYGILGVVLALILVNGKVLGDDQLVSYLRRLSLYPSTPVPLTLSSPHPTTLPLAAYLTQLTKAQYLERSKTSPHPGGATQLGAGRPAATAAASGSTQRRARQSQGGVGLDGQQEAGDPSIEWKWGARAEAEIGEEGVARFVQVIFEQGGREARRGGGGGGGDAGGEGRKKRKGQTGEKFLMEVARAAGVKDLKTSASVEGGGFS